MLKIVKNEVASITNLHDPKYRGDPSALSTLTILTPT